MRSRMRKQLGCTHLVDAATLTGAIVVALGYTSSGVFTNNDALLGRWMTAAKDAGEKMWHMPLDDEYRDQLKTVYRRYSEHRWPLGRRMYRGHVPEGVRRRDAVGARGHRRALPGWTTPNHSLRKGRPGIPLGAFVNLALNWK